MRVDIEQAGDDIGAVQIDGVRARLAQHTREAAVFHGEGPVLKAEFLRIDHCILKLHGISPSVRAQAFLRSSGRLAAATDWPTRRVFSSGSMTRTFCASSGYSSFRMDRQVSRMTLPPRPDMTRPSTIMWCTS